MLNGGDGDDLLVPGTEDTADGGSGDNTIIGGGDGNGSGNGDWPENWGASMYYTYGFERGNMGILVHRNWGNPNRTLNVTIELHDGYARYNDSGDLVDDAASYGGPSTVTAVIPAGEFWATVTVPTFGNGLVDEVPKWFSAEITDGGIPMSARWILGGSQSIEAYPIDTDLVGQTFEFLKQPLMISAFQSVRTSNYPYNPSLSTLTILSIASPPVRGTAWLNPDGLSIGYSPDGSSSGEDYFSYTLSNGYATTIASVHLMGPPNQAPTSISPTSASVAENAPIGTLITELSASDPNLDPVTFSLVSGAFDNAAFSIEGNQLLSNTEFNYATKARYTIQVRATDPGGLSYEQCIAVDVTALEENAIYGWEGGDLNFYAKASVPDGGIAMFELDLDEDGIYDFWTTEIDADGQALRLGLVGFLQIIDNPIDSGTYSAKLRVTTSENGTAIFPVEITIGNVPPNIQFNDNALVNVAGVPFSLPISTSDPGPDTVSQILVDWGDGSSTTIQGSSGSPTHVYTTDGHYIIRATATDDDGSSSAKHEIDVGEDIDPPADNGEPVILSANAVILANGNARLTIEAEDNSGFDDDLTYEWDLDGDGEFETQGDNTIVIPPGDGPNLYQVQVRITDGAGRWAEGRFQFTDRRPANCCSSG
jgi:hypothetical protein